MMKRALAATAVCLLLLGAMAGSVEALSFPFLDNLFGGLQGIFGQTENVVGEAANDPCSSNADCGAGPFLCINGRCGRCTRLQNQQPWFCQNNAGQTVGYSQCGAVTCNADGTCASTDNDQPYCTTGGRPVCCGWSNGQKPDCGANGCTNFRTDANNCGSAGKVCGARETCENGACVSSEPSCTNHQCSKENVKRCNGDVVEICRTDPLQNNCRVWEVHANCALTNEMCAETLTNAECTTQPACTKSSDCADGNECTSNVCLNGACLNPHRPDGATCSDGVCQAGQCVKCIENSDCADGNQCTTNVCSNGVCSNPPRNDGTTCPDGTCQGGQCVVQGSDQCNPACPSHHICVNKVCKQKRFLGNNNGPGGSNIYGTGWNGRVDMTTLSAPAQAQYQNTLCTSNQCSGIPQDGFAGSASSLDGCFNKQTVLPQTSWVCLDAIGSIVGPTLYTCYGSGGPPGSNRGHEGDYIPNANNPRFCCAYTGTTTSPHGYEFVGQNHCMFSYCSTGDDDCGPGQTCNKITGQCEGGCTTNADCTGGNACTNNVCNSDGTCSYPVAPDGTMCDVGRTCQSGQCVECTNNDQCTDGNGCTQDVCSNGVCSNPPKPNGATCNDGNQCTGPDKCTNGVCSGPNNGQCGGCQAPNCQVNGQCISNGQEVTACKVCNNGNVVNKPSGTSCSDGNQCTGPDTCSNGVCGGPNNGQCSGCTNNDQCTDGNGCTQDVCSNGVCSNPPKPNSTSCDDDDACTTGDACDGSGVCTGTPDPACQCQDECDPTTHPYCSFGTPTGSNQCIQGEDGCYDEVFDECDTDEYCEDSGNPTTGGLCYTTGDCGDGDIDFLEECDDGSSNGACPAACSSTCSSNTCGAEYCGDGVVNQGWEVCDGGADCEAWCLPTGQCPDLVLAQITVDKASNVGVGDVTKTVFVGGEGIPSGSWFLVQDMNGVSPSDPALNTFEDVPGLAVQRKEGGIRVIEHGTLPSGSSELVNGTITFFKGNATNITSDHLIFGGNNGMEPPPQDFATEQNGVVSFRMSVGPGDDGFFVNVTQTGACVCQNECNINGNFPRCSTNGKRIVNCEVQPDTCTDVVRTTCSPNGFCDDSGSTPVCTPFCFNECEPGEQACFVDITETCNVNGPNECVGDAKNDPNWVIGAPTGANVMVDLFVQSPVSSMNATIICQDGSQQGVLAFETSSGKWRLEQHCDDVVFEQDYRFSFRVNFDSNVSPLTSFPPDVYGEVFSPAGTIENSKRTCLEGNDQCYDWGIPIACTGGNLCDEGFCIATHTCSDGTDNDGDGLIDLFDPGCACTYDTDENDLSDNGETDCNAGQNPDGCADSVDVFPLFTSGDTDGDGVADDCDNCIFAFNPNQDDEDNDGKGNVCDADFCSDECHPDDYPVCAFSASGHSGSGGGSAGGGSAGPSGSGSGGGGGSERRNVVSSKSLQCILGPNGCYDLVGQRCGADEWCSDTTMFCEVTGLCGNGVIDFAEECDNGEYNNVCPAKCGEDCSINNCAGDLCGNGILDPNEQCDDGNARGGDGCSAVCTNEPFFCDDGRQSFRWISQDGGIPLHTPLGNAGEVVGTEQLPTLLQEEISTPLGMVEYNQSFRFGKGPSLFEFTNGLLNIFVAYTEDEEDQLGDFLVIDDDAPSIEWGIHFGGPYVGLLEGNDVQLQGMPFPVMNENFVIVSATTNTAGTSLDMVLMSGSIADGLLEGETRTYSIGRLEYEVTLVFVSDPTSGVEEARLSVNGELTAPLREGGIDVLGSTVNNDIIVGIRDIDASETEGSAQIFLDATKIEFSDPNTTDVSFDGSVEVNEENIEDAKLAIHGGFPPCNDTPGSSASCAAAYAIYSLTYRLAPDPLFGTVAYIPSGNGLREHMDETEGLLSSSLDLRYNGVNAPTIKYEDYDKTDREAEFIIYPSVASQFEDDSRHIVWFSQEGEGTALIDGFYYPMRLDDVTSDEPEIEVDLDDDGSFNVVLEEFDSLFIAEQSVSEVVADVRLHLGRCRLTEGFCGDGVLNGGGRGVSVVYADYNHIDRTLFFEPTARPSITVPVNADGVGFLVFEGETYSVRVSNVSDPSPSLFVDVDADGELDIEVLITTEFLLTQGDEECDIGTWVPTGYVCNDECEFELGGICGNGIIETGETCDNGGVLNVTVLNRTTIVVPTYGKLFSQSSGVYLSSSPLQFAGSSWEVVVNFDLMLLVLSSLPTIHEIPLKHIPETDTYIADMELATNLGVWSNASITFEFDDKNFGADQVCSDHGNFTSGTLSCDPVTCIFDTSHCAVDISCDQPVVSKHDVFLREPVVLSLTDADLSILADFRAGSSTGVQTLALNGPRFTGVNFLENEDDSIGAFWVIEDDASFLTYEVTFTPALSGTRSGSTIPDLIGQEWNILGETYNVTDVHVGPLGQITFDLDSNGRQISFAFFSFNGTEDGLVEVDFEAIEDAELSAVGSYDGTDLTLESFTYTLTMDADAGSTAYVDYGQGIRSVIDEPDGLLSRDWDILYKLNTPALGQRPISFVSRGDDEYMLGFSDDDDTRHLVPFLSNERGIFKFGDDDDDFVFVEGMNTSDWNIGDDDYFLLSANGLSTIWRYDDYDATDFQLSFSDESDGSTVDVPVAADGTASLVVAGETFLVHVDDRTSTAPLLAIDMNADGDISGDVIDVYVWGGVLSLANVSFENASGFHHINIHDVVGNGKTIEDTVVNPSSPRDVRVLPILTIPSVDERIAATLMKAPNQEMDLTFFDDHYLMFGTLFANNTAGEAFGFDLFDTDSFGDYKIGLSDYGVVMFHFSMQDEANDLGLYVGKERISATITSTVNPLCTPQECSDGIDNDKDTLIDTDDPDCDSPSDDSEAPFCGDGSCNGDESCSTCSADCGTCSSGGGGGGSFRRGGGGGGAGGGGGEGDCSFGWHWDEFLDKCMKDADPFTGTSRSFYREPVQPEPEEPGLRVSFDRSLRVDPLTIVTYDVRVSANDATVSDVTVRLDVPSDWEYSGPIPLGSIPEGESRVASFKIAVGGLSIPEDTITVRVNSGNAGSDEGTVQATIACPEFLAKARPSVDQYTPGDIIPVYVIVCNTRSSPQEDLEVFVDVNSGRTTVFSDYLTPFDIPRGGKIVEVLPVPASSVLGKGAVTDSVLRQRGKTIKRDTHSIPSN